MEQAKNKLNILLVTPGFPCEKNGSQAAKFVYLEALSYTENGANVKVITPHYPGVPEYEKLNDNLEVYRFRYSKPEFLEKLIDPLMSIYDKKPFWAYLLIPFFIFNFCWTILKFAKWSSIIHCQWSLTVLLALPAKFLFGKKVVVTARGSDIRLPPKFINTYIFKTVDAAIDCYGPQKWNNDNKKNFESNYIQLPLITLNPEKHLMPEDMGKAIADSPNCFKIIYLGRFDNVKLNHSEMPLLTLIDVAAKLKIKKYNFKILYIGDGEAGLVNEMKNKVNELALNNEVFFLGFKSNVNEYISNTDLGIGGIALNTVCQEFLAYHVPMIIVDNHENHEALWIDKVNSFFIKPHHEESLLSAIEYAINNKTGLREIAENAARMTKQYIDNPKDGGKRYLESFRQLLNQK